jgi:hypothetical protein
MKNIFLTLLVLLLLTGCKKESRNSENCGDLIDLSKPVDSAILKKYHYDTITFNPIDLNILNLKAGSIYYDASVPSVIWSLTIELYDSINPTRRIYFSVQDPHNNKDSLIKKGSHSATGQGGDAINNNLQSAGFTLNSLTSDEMEIYFEDMVLHPDNKISAKGYITIKKEIYWKWPAGIWNGINYIYPCDEDYLDYCFPVYYMPLKIYFNTIEKS